MLIMNKDKEKKGMAEGTKGVFSTIKETFREWSDDDAFSDSASIAYYSILSLPGLLFLIVYFAGLFLGEQAVQGKISEQIGSVIGPDAAGFVQSLIQNSSQNNQSYLALIVGFASVGLSATAVFMQLQKVLNKIWKVEPKNSKEAGILTLLLHRLVSFGLILLLGLLLLASIVIASALTLLSGWISSVLPSDFAMIVFYSLSFAVIFLLISTFFAMIYKFLPDAKIEWKSAWIGAFVTTVLFCLGAVGLQIYFKLSNPASAYGVAGSLILILLWAYYSSLIFLLGAEFTKVYVRSHSRGIVPSKYATLVSGC